MLRLLKRLIGLDDAPPPAAAPRAAIPRAEPATSGVPTRRAAVPHTPAPPSAPPSSAPDSSARRGRLEPETRSHDTADETSYVAKASAGASAGADDLVNRYFQLSTIIERGKADRDFRAAARAARETYPLLPALVRQWKREYGSWDIVTSHAVHTAPTLMAVLEDADGIRELRAALQEVKELREWLPAADHAEEDLALVPRIMAAVEGEPGLLQSSLKVRLGLADASRSSQLAAWLEKAGRLYRVKKGSSFQLYRAGYVIPSVRATTTTTTFSSSSSSPSSSSTTPGISSSSSSSSSSTKTQPPLPAASARPPRAWMGRSAARARLLDFSGLPVVRLPMAPPAWEARDAEEQNVLRTFAQKPGKAEKKGEPRFVVEGEGWSLASEEKLPPADRPDPAFKEVFPTAVYTHWLDPKGKREGFEYAASVLRVTDREGRVTAERGLAHDVYRADVNADGTGILFLSREGVLHGYTERLDPVLELRLLDLPEYQAQAARLGIEPRELKNHTRCVAIDADRRRYLVTVVDEAWCLETTTGEVVWGFRMPTKEGWTRYVADRSDRVGTSAEVEAALRRMELELPVTPDDIIQQYRKLARRWHPDRNPGDSGATARFQELGADMELLTGTDLSGLGGGEVERITYQQVLATQRFEVQVPDVRGGSMGTGVGIDVSVGLVVSEKFAADWIYAANIGKDGRTYLAGYSGKVVVVSPRGIPERVYDIGAVPRHIVDAGEHLYILTDTRLYVLAGDRLEALVDVYGAGDVVVADRGFGLLEQRQVTWFTPDGRRVGAVRTKDPLRRTFSTSTGLVVETRQHRGLVAGTPAWWSVDQGGLHG